MDCFLLGYDLLTRAAGIFFILLISFFCSENKKKIDIKSSFYLFGSIFFLAYCLLSFRLGVVVIDNVASVFDTLYLFALEGVEFVFGNLVSIDKFGFIFAIRVLPMIIFFSAFTGILYYFNIIQLFVAAVGYCVRPLYKTTGPETVCAIANSFLSQTEAPLLIRKYLKNMTDSEIFVVMVSGMATISSSLFAVYGSLGMPMKHLLISSILSIPGSLLIAKIIVPATGEEKDIDYTSVSEDSGDFFTTLSEWVSNGLMIALNVGAMLIAIISLLSVFNFLIALLGNYISVPGLSLNKIFSIIMYPAAFFLGIPESEIPMAASCIGSKVAINEMIAYISLGGLAISKKTFVYLTYALCGFSNFSCIGIQLSFLGGVESSLKSVVSRLGVRAVFAALFVNLMNAYIVGFFI